jgi:hypothetical protein
MENQSPTLSDVVAGSLQSGHCCRGAVAGCSMEILAETSVCSVRRKKKRRGIDTSSLACGHPLPR